jgi:hydrogenase expression/formation protein HypE
LNPQATPLDDAARIDINGTALALTTDSFVVKPLVFPGGSIGELAVNGTVNDLAVSAARCEAMVVSFVLEAGLPTPVLQAEIEAMGAAARKAGIKILGGDTKVVEHGKADHMYITTTGLGVRIPGNRNRSALGSRRRQNSSLRRDRRSWHHHFAGARRTGHGRRYALGHPVGDASLVAAVLQAAGPGVRWMRDPTRGGVATSLNELARDCGLGIVIKEEETPGARRRSRGMRTAGARPACTSPTKVNFWR